MSADLHHLEAKLGYSFKQRSLLVRALSHKSLAAERKGGEDSSTIDNEQFEFLGDSILGFLVSEYLIAKYPTDPEGRLSKLKAQLVSATHLYHVAQQLDLGRFLHLGRGEEMSGGRQKKALLSNAVEAVIAALYLDGNMTVARYFVESYVMHGSDSGEGTPGTGIVDYKTALQERVQALGLAQPRYVIMEENGPEHSKTFVIEVRVGPTWSGRGEGPSKKAAGQKAAKVLLGLLP